MWPIWLACLLFIVCRIYLSSMTPCNTSLFITWLVQLIFSIHYTCSQNLLKVTFSSFAALNSWSYGSYLFLGNGQTLFKVGGFHNNDWILSFCRMWYYMIWYICTDILEETAASVIKIDELYQATGCSVTSVHVYHVTWYYISEENNVQSNIAA